MPAEKPRLLAQVRGRMRARHLSPRTEQAYVGWILRHIRDHGTRHPAQMQALSALVLLYREVLALPVGVTLAPT